MPYSQDWLTFCFGETEPTPMELYWIVPKSCAEGNHEKVWNGYIVYFEDLAKEFPAVSRIALRNQY